MRGSPLLLTIIIQIFSPHFRLLLIYIYKGIYRCYDRGFTLNQRTTQQIIQEDYEDLYSGPHF